MISLKIMRFGRRSVFVASLVAVLAMAAGCSSTKSALETPQADASEVSVLFSVLAPSMDVAVSGDSFTLSIPANSSTAWFTDRPDRNAGTMTVADLVSTWSAQSFDADPPNAAVAVTVNGEQHQHVVELSNPVIAGGVVTFRAVDVSDDASTDAVAGRNATDRVIAGHFENAELFIDDGTLPPCPSTMTSAPSTSCVLAPNDALELEITTSSNQCVAITRTSDTEEYVKIGPSPVPLVESIDTNYTEDFGYTSGQTWHVSGWPDALTVGFGGCS